MPARCQWTHTPIRREGAKVKLFCFPYAGGGSAAFRNWPEALSRDVEVSYVQLPGREVRIYEPPLTALKPLVTVLTEELSRRIDRPYFFYGHSLGATIAFETVRELRRKGIEGPTHLFVAACPAPHLKWPHPPIHRLSEEDFLSEVERRYGGVPSAVRQDAELRNLFVPALRADIEILETYQYRHEPAVACSISAFGGLDDPMVPVADLRAWGQHTCRSFSVQMFEGNHFFHVPDQKKLLQCISAKLSVVPRGAYVQTG